MKKLNTLFCTLYVLVFVWSIWFGINVLVNRGLDSLFDDATELFFAFVYVLALLFCIYMHYKLRNKPISANVKICVGSMSINVLFVTSIYIWSLIDRNTFHNMGLAAFLPVLLILGLWGLSLLAGIGALREKTE